MKLELGKLFIGGISWDTNEDRLREYFQNFGEVVEAVIMKDRNTGRARGFGFIVFADPYVAERVVMEKHVIDGRTVEAKKAVPRDDQTITNKNTNSIYGSPGPARTKKIFVGGLASTVTDSDFKNYFDQFGMITDVVVMYDHNTQRPRGFGFITYDSEEAVEKVLLKTFHELNGKMVEVKRAVPKELSPGPSRNQLGSYNYGLSRVSCLINGYTQGYNQNSIGGYGVRTDGRFSPVTVGRSGYPSLSPAGHGIGQNFETGFWPSFGVGGNFSSNLSYGRGVNPLYSGQSNRHGSPIWYGSGNVGSGSALSSINRNMWGNQSLNYDTNSAESNAFMGSENGNSGVGAFGSLGAIWSSSISGQRGTTSAYNSGSLGYGIEETNFGSGEGGYARNSRTNVAPASSHAASSDSYYGAFADFYDGRSMYEDPTWQPSSSQLEGSGPFGFGLRNAASNVNAKSSVGNDGGYGVTSRQSIRGIAA